jgi:hypothetical protein
MRANRAARANNRLGCEELKVRADSWDCEEFDYLPFGHTILH